MKKILILSLLAVFCVGNISAASPKIKKSDLRVLYVGGSSDWDARTYANTEDPEAAIRNDIKQRMASFETMLKDYFTHVTVIHADEYTQAMSDDYDVTVMDGKPREIAPVFSDEAKRIYMKAGYFTEDFDKPIITIGQLSSDLGARVGTKNDWYCLCLDAHALGWKAGHPVFTGPFEVKMTVENKPTPEQFFSSTFTGETLPAKTAMWRVQTKGYETDEGFAIGLVSRPEGYEDSPEAEVISGGVSSKSIDAVAIARHGNWFHWGFAASPIYMTDEAKTVFANAVVYISKFDRQGIIARKYNELIATRATVDEMKFMTSQKGYEQLLEAEASANRAIEEMRDKAIAKKERGEKLDDMEEYMINFVVRDPRSREDMLKVVAPDFFEMFGTDEQAYAKFFDENYNYFYAGPIHSLVVDEDAKSLGIPNDDIRLIDEAIRMLEARRDADKGRRILARYTLVDFPTAAEWRGWFNKNKDNMFFTQAGGWVWLINSREPGVNDYRVWEARQALVKVPQGETTANSPVVVNATMETLQNGDRAVYVTMKVHPGYHTYDRVASSDPYIPTKVEFTLPAGSQKVGELQTPRSISFNTKGTTVFEETVVFTQVISGTGVGEVTCTVNYQCCDNNVCFPPVEKVFSFELK